MFGKKSLVVEQIEQETAFAEAFPDAKKFFMDCGCKYLNDPENGRHAIQLYVSNDLKGVRYTTPFRYEMGRDDLVELHFALTHQKKLDANGNVVYREIETADEKTVKKPVMKPVKEYREVIEFIRCINEAINDYYSKGETISFNIETRKSGSYEKGNISVELMLRIIIDIMIHTLENSIGGSDTKDYDKIENLGQLYLILGEKNGTKQFFKDVFRAAEASIPDKPHGNVAVLKTPPEIRCYTCKYLKVGPTGIRTDGKVETAITGEQFDKHPDRYLDAHRKADSGQLVSAIIDGRRQMKSCADYQHRIKL